MFIGDFSTVVPEPYKREFDKLQEQFGDMFLHVRDKMNSTVNAEQLKD